MPDSILRAIEQGDSARVREILAEDPGAAGRRDENGVSALMLALYHRAHEALDLLLGTDPELDVFEAAALGREDRLRDVMREDADMLGARSPDGFTPLHLACFFGRESTVDLLLDGGADANAVAENASRVQPLHSAAAGRSRGILENLLRRGASVNARQSGGFTALHAATRQGDAALTRLLLEYGADPAQADDEGLSPTDHAREEGHEHLLDLLEGD